jgi:hypothetical protein
MCPVCLTTSALAVAGVTSASGLAAVVAARLRATRNPSREGDPLEEPDRLARGVDRRPQAAPLKLPTTTGY